ncbi:hypothetical protein B0T26DRAFT_491010 [Lasiosphaeria miniovina]|uniref:Uncharacterized protein n=1 Tax=Lasiosphaeria miniovina TaxID=1954250 RepID=A0AA40DHC2_9PEZI|nr:uncharacterized protein B0T26DRAFT_491010 [Lasiosphaeria miniovina]KAK0703145.1 hypothetical protein B0T26DRAFT_491010 [Lasiosphaeria miniovina]
MSRLSPSKFVYHRSTLARLLPSNVVYKTRPASCASTARHYPEVSYVSTASHHSHRSRLARSLPSKVLHRSRLSLSKSVVHPRSTLPSSVVLRSTLSLPSVVHHSAPTLTRPLSMVHRSALPSVHKNQSASCASTASRHRLRLARSLPSSVYYRSTLSKVHKPTLTRLSSVVHHSTPTLTRPLSIVHHQSRLTRPLSSVVHPRSTHHRPTLLTVEIQLGASRGCSRCSTCGCRGPRVQHMQMQPGIQGNMQGPHIHMQPAPPAAPDAGMPWHMPIQPWHIQHIPWHIHDMQGPAHARGPARGYYISWYMQGGAGGELGTVGQGVSQLLQAPRRRSPYEYCWPLPAMLYTAEERWGLEN